MKVLTTKKEMVIMWADGGISKSYGGNPFVIEVCQINMYTLNLHNVKCQLYLNKFGRKTKGQ